VESEDILQESGPEAAGAVTRVLREALRTPTFVELLKVWMNSTDREKAHQFVGTLLWEDPSLFMSALSVTPEILNTLADVLVDLGENLDRFPPQLLDSYVDEILADIDTEKLKEIPGAYLPVLENINLHDRVFDAVKKVLAEADYGRVREVVTEHLETATEEAGEVLAIWLENPVIIANLLGIVPPLINSVIKLLSVTADELDMPPEVLASALFFVLSSVDAEELGRMLSNLSGQVNSLHAGNLVLGGEEPYFRQVFDDFCKRLFDNLDMKAAAGAISALGEDLEVMLGVLARQASRDPEMLLPIVETLASLSGSIFGIFSEALAEWTALPDETLYSISNAIYLNTDAVEIGRTMDSMVTLALRLREANPDIRGDRLAEAVEAMNTERLELLTRGLTGDVKKAALSNPGIRQMLEPEEVGKRVNEAIAGFNASASPIAVHDYLERLFATIDPKELGYLMSSVAGGFIEAVFSSRETALAVMKTVFSAVVGIGSNLVKLIFRKG
jgi:hypothetical protein